MTIKKDKVELFTYTLGNSDKDCTIDKGLIHSWFTDTYEEAEQVMKDAKKYNKWKKGYVVKCTFEKVIKS